MRYVKRPVFSVKRQGVCLLEMFAAVSGLMLVLVYGASAFFASEVDIILFAVA